MPRETAEGSLEHLDHRGKVNSMTHGVYHYLATGEFPLGCEDIAEEAGNLRADLTSEVIEKHGKVSVTKAEGIDAVITHFVIGMVLQRWLKNRQGELDLEKELKILQDIARAVDRRGSRLQQLDLDSQADVLDLQAIIREAHETKVAS